MANISLQGRELTGYIPMTLSQLPALSGLFLQYNKLWGTIPRNLSSLTNLTNLYLNNNTLSGAIPPEIGQLSNLQGTPIHHSIPPKSLQKFTLVSERNLLGMEIMNKAIE